MALAYVEQYQRLRRSYAKLGTPRSTGSGPRPAGSGSELQKDDYYHFCQDCWHLKEWVEKTDDAATATPRKQAVTDAYNDHHIGLARDIAIAVKHLVGGPGLLAGGQIAPRQDATIDLGAGASFTTFYVDSPGSRLDHFTLADAAMDAWDRILAQNGLPMIQGDTRTERAVAG